MTYVPRVNVIPHDDKQAAPVRERGRWFAACLCGLWQPCPSEADARDVADRHNTAVAGRGAS